jgi:hypothetical protein
LIAEAKAVREANEKKAAEVAQAATETKPVESADPAAAAPRAPMPAAKRRFTAPSRGARAKMITMRRRIR